MDATRLRRIAIVGLVTATAAMTALGLHHFRCRATAAGPFVAGDVVTPPMACVETYPSEIVPVLMALGLVGFIATLWGAIRLTRAGAQLQAGRVTVGLAAALLLVPTALPFVGWASAGFGFTFAKDQPDGGRYCTGISGDQPSLWLQTSMCVESVELVLLPLLMIAGALAVLAATRASRRSLIAALAVSGIALVVHAASILFGPSDLDLSSAAPLAGILLAAVSIPMLRPRAAPEAAPS